MTTATEVGRILLVDQSRGALLFQETILRRREAVVTTALAGSEGLQKARQEQPQLIMFAFDLFDMSAPEFCREIRNDDRTRGISLLLVCDRENGEHQDLCLAAGCNDVIYRPLQRNDLDAKITRLTSIPTRRELRTLTRIEVSLEKNGRFLIGRSLNISATGMLLELDRVLPGDGSCGSTSICPASRSRCRWRRKFCAPNLLVSPQNTVYVFWRSPKTSASASRSSCGGSDRESSSDDEQHFETD